MIEIAPQTMLGEDRKLATFWIKSFRADHYTSSLSDLSGKMDDHPRPWSVKRANDSARLVGKPLRGRLPVYRLCT